MRLVNFQRVKGKPTRLLIEVADSPKNIRKLSEQYGFLHELQVTGTPIQMSEAESL